MRINQEMRDLSALIADNDHEHRLSYGALHIVIADENLEDDHIRWCLGPENSSSHPLTELERQIGERLLALNLHQRRIVLREVERLWQQWRWGRSA